MAKKHRFFKAENAKHSEQRNALINQITRSQLPCFHVPKIVGFRPARFVLVRCIQALYELISALSWAFLDASKELVLISKGFWKKVAEKAHFGLGPRLESPRFEWTWKQAEYVQNENVTNHCRKITRIQMLSITVAKLRI